MWLYVKSIHTTFITYSWSNFEALLKNCVMMASRKGTNVKMINTVIGIII